MNSDSKEIDLMGRKALIFSFFMLGLLTFVGCANTEKVTPQADETHAAIKTFFVPEGAEITTDMENLLIIYSTQPFSELVEFYENACHELDLNEAEINDAQEGIWIFSGIYYGFHIHQRATGLNDESRERPLNIELRDKGGSVEIEIVY
jgi:hypothetical protein